MVQKIHPRGVIWVPSFPPHAGHLSKKNDDLAVQYEDLSMTDTRTTFNNRKTLCVGGWLSPVVITQSILCLEPTYYPRTIIHYTVQ